MFIDRDANHGFLAAHSLRASVKRAPPLLDMGDEFMLEMRQCRPQPRPRRRPEAQNVLPKMPLQSCLELLQIARRALPRLDPAQHFHDPVQPFAARRALAAGLGGRTR